MFMGGENGQRVRTSNKRNAKLFLAEMKERGTGSGKMPQSWIGWSVLIVSLICVLAFVLAGLV